MNFMHFLYVAHSTDSNNTWSQFKIAFYSNKTVPSELLEWIDYESKWLETGSHDWIFNCWVLLFSTKITSKSIFLLTFCLFGFAFHIQCGIDDLLFALLFDGFKKICNFMLKTSNSLRVECKCAGQQWLFKRLIKW